MSVTLAAAFGGVLAEVPGTEASATVTGVTVAGGNGSGSAANQLSLSTEFNFPSGVAVDGAGNVYVSDFNNGRVQKWAPGATSGVTVAGGNGVGSAANQIDAPTGLFVDSAGNLYVADAGLNNRVQKWAPGATSGVTVAGGNGNGSAANQLGAPNAVFVDGSGNVYVSDLYNDRVQEWAPGATSGVTVAGGNGEGVAANQLDQPDAVSVDGSGNVYVADTANRVQKWGPGATAGVTVAGGSAQGSDADQLNFPEGLFVDSSGNIYVSDGSNNRVQEWAPGATAGVTVAGGPATSAANSLSFPEGVWVDGSGNLYVADSQDQRVQAWQAGPNGAPADNVDPLSQAVSGTQAVSFTADARGQLPLAVQWQRSTDGGTTWSDISGATSSMYTIGSVPLADNGFEFRAVFSNAAGSVTTGAATLTVHPPVAPVITEQPNSETVLEGSGVGFNAFATGGPPPSVEWQLSTDGGSTWSDTGDTGNTYAINAVPLADNGFEFRAVFTNTAGSATTNPATLTVNPLVAPAMTTQPATQTAPINTSVTLTAAASGAPAPTVQWQQSTDGGSTWGNIAGATSGTYFIASVPASDNGREFRAVFTNGAGSATSNPATLTVTAPPPTTSVALPSNGATVSSNIWLDAVASSAAGIASVKFEVSGGSVTDKVVSSSGRWFYGYLGAWDTTDVPNGTYTLQSVATDALGQSTTSAGVTVTVDNLALHTTVLVPSAGAALSGTSAVLDASATGTAAVTSVQFEVSGGSVSNQVVGTATPSLYGWYFVWNTTTVANGTYTLQSVATESGGTTATSPGVTVTVTN